jgi:uncharacterized membrane protein
MKSKQMAPIIFALWLIIVFMSMLFVERIDLALFFVLGFIGFIVIVELMEPTYVKPGYAGHIRLLIALGIVIIGAIVAEKILEVLGWEIILEALGWQIIIG